MTPILLVLNFLISNQEATAFCDIYGREIKIKNNTALVAIDNIACKGCAIQLVEFLKHHRKINHVYIVFNFEIPHHDDRVRLIRDYQNELDLDNNKYLFVTNKNFLFREKEIIGSPNLQIKTSNEVIILHFKDLFGQDKLLKKDIDNLLKGYK